MVGILSMPGSTDGQGFGVIYSDPPWDYDDAGAIRRFPGTRKGRADAHYQTVGLEGLKAMRPLLDSWASEDCALLMWGTWPKLGEFMDLGRAWGFEYVTCAFVWVKTKRDAEQPMMFPGSLQAMAYCGMGFYTRSGTEFCGLWRRGKPSIPEDRSIRQVVFAPVREHSRKPPEVRHRIERLWPEATRLEMFARERAPNWSAWGNETDKFGGEAA